MVIENKKYMTRPFFIGQEVVALKTFKEERKACGFKYPNKRDIVTVTGIFYRCSDNKWFISIAESDCPQLFANCFAPVSLLRISDELTIAADLLQPQVEERADVEIINA